jgi:multiple sugar transport system permease protein
VRIALAHPLSKKEMAGRAAAAPITARRKRRRPLATPYLLGLPVILYIGIVILYPIGVNVYTSFTRQELLSNAPAVWVGLRNYARMLHDTAFWHALRTTFIYTFLVVVLTMVTALLVALLMNAKFVGRSVVRAAITLPYAVPEVAAVLVWSWMFSQQFGVLNRFVRAVLPVSENVHWLTEPRLAMFSILLVTLWKIFPFYSLVILTALQTVEQELYEAARIDGAGPFASFWNITLPGIAPTLSILTLLATIYSFRRFVTIYLLTGGGPGTSTQTLVVSVYETTFRSFNISYGATLGVVGFLVTVVIAGGYFALQRRLGDTAL